MSIYSKNGNQLSNAYGLTDSLNNAYDVNGEIVFSKGSGQPDYSDYSYIQKWASKGIGSTQGFAIYDNKVFWVSKSGDSTVPANCYVFNLSDGSQALSSAYISAYTGHGNSLSMAFPKLYAATAYAGGKVHVSTFSNDFLTNTFDKTLALPDTSYGCDACIDEMDKDILWSIHHTAPITDLVTPWRIKKWNLLNLTDNGNGTYTPELLQNIELNQPANSPYFQGCYFHDGILWFANGYSGSASGAYVFGVDPDTGEYLYSINCETTAEPEGVAWYPDSDAVGGYAMYVGFQGMMLRKYTFAQSTL